MLIRKRQQAVREAFQKGFFGSWHRQAEAECERRCAAGRKVAQVDCESLVAEPRRIDRREEMAAFDEHVAGDREHHAGRGCEQRAVVAHAERNTARRPREVALDELEFAEGGHESQRLSAASSW